MQLSAYIGEAKPASVPGAAVWKFWTRPEPRSAETSSFLHFQTTRCREFMRNKSRRICDLAKRYSSHMASRFIIVLSFPGEMWTLSWWRRKAWGQWYVASFLGGV